MPKSRILIIEDEPKLAAMTAGFLREEGYDTAVCLDGAGALDEIRRYKPDLVILDVMLPGKSGLEICRAVRQESALPVIMVTAKTEEIDVLLGLELGADDYITKPFSLRQLAARVKAVLRRSGSLLSSHQDLVKYDGLQIDFTAHEVIVAGEKVELTPTEFNILGTLAKNPGRIFSRAQLLEAALGEVYLGYERSIDTHISNLRKKLEVDPANPKYILTVFGVGYKFAR